MAVILDALKKRSTILRCLYNSESKSCLIRKLALSGIQATAPCSARKTRICSQLYALSARIFFTREFYAFEKSDSRFGVMNVPAGQYHIQKLHSLVEEDVNFGILKPNGHSDALCKKWSQSQAR